MRRSRSARTRPQRLVRALSMLLLIAPAGVRAEEPCAAQHTATPTMRWPAPLDRRVTLHGRDVALRDALDQLATAARLRLSYSPELLTLDRRVCVSYDSIAAGAVLGDLLAGSPVTPVVAGSDQIVLAPAAAAQTAPPRAQRSVSVLDRVIVTGSPVGAPQRGLAGAVTIIDRAELAHQSGATLSQTLNGMVPGVWLWEQSPSDLLARYGSLRGASSFGVSYPKVYIDGIEVANPLLITELSADAVERVEVIRGPQGAALYGADAIGGVVNIVMRHDGGDGADVAQLRSSAGLTHSAFVDRPALVQQHTLSLRGGSDVRSSSLSVTLGSVGSYVPGAQSHEAEGNAEFRILGTRSMLTGTARVYGKDAGVGTSPFTSTTSLSDFDGAPAGHEQWRGSTRDYAANQMPRQMSSSTQSVREYTLGGTASFSASETWTHAVTVGIDGYRLSGAAASIMTPIPSAADSALHAAWGAADRLTVRASSIARTGTTDGVATTFMLGADYSTLQQNATAPPPSLGDRAVRDYSGWQGTGGLVGQVDASWHNTVFATAGLRAERDDGFSATTGLATLPILGGATVHDIGPMTMKLRAAYGTGIRPVGSVVRSSWTARQSVVLSPLAPEEQSGIEAGFDAFVGHAFALHLTRFDQHAFNLIQPVAVASAPSYPNGAENRAIYALENVGEIGNRGWELESSIARGAFSLTGTASLLDSRVRRLAFGYTGDLQPGDRMLGVPSKMAGLTSAWTAPTWSASITVTRAAGWINYDGLALAAATTAVGHAIVSDSLRAYWRSYPGVTRLDATFARDLFTRFRFVAAGHNLLDAQRGEPDNLTVVPGRTLTVGLQARF